MLSIGILIKEAMTRVGNKRKDRSAGTAVVDFSTLSSF
jgi:hypothetical protein